LTDGEIVSALYIAQYRKLDVKVLLGRGKANGYMSRLNYLKNQNVPVFLRPNSFRIPKPTALLTDDALVYIDSELDFMAKKRSFIMAPALPAEVRTFVDGFMTAAGQQVPAVPRPVPLVGRAGNSTRGIYRPGNRLPAVRNSYQSGNHEPGMDASGAYIYDGSRAPKPAGVPDRLPKNTIQQQQQRQTAP
jgi:hypothetical protein